ncbi:MAG: type IV secretion system protein [Treponema sp.]|jgi:type IV secretion system protein VirB5|nr:type IV secretion system protein [Treponema sp.]
MPQSFYVPEGTNGTAFTRDDRNLEMADTIDGLAQKNARTWQIIALVSLSSFFISLGVLVYAVSLPKTVPVVVTVNPEGEAVYAGKIDKSSYGKTAVPDIAREYQVKRLLTKTHQWVADKEAQQAYIAEAQSIVQSNAVRQLDLFFRSNNPFAEFGNKTRSVAIEPPLKQTDKTYIVYFTTLEKLRSGYEGEKIRWSALINLDQYEPSIENPLGLYITNFDIKAVEEQ